MMRWTFRRGFPAVREEDVRHAWHGRRDGAARGNDDHDGATPASHVHLFVPGRPRFKSEIPFTCTGSCWTT